MRLTRQKRIIERQQLNMPAMIDVVMLLLIFFMCTTAFNEPEKTLFTQVSRHGTGRGTNIEDFEPVEIVLRKSKNGVSILCDGQVCKSFEILGRLLRARRQLADVKVIIKGHDDVPFWYMVAAVDTCYGAQLRRVAFSTKGEIE